MSAHELMEEKARSDEHLNYPIPESTSSGHSTARESVLQPIDPTLPQQPLPSARPARAGAQWTWVNNP